MTDPLDALALDCGILPEFRDLSGATRPTAPETKRALLRATGLALDSDAMIAEALAERRAAREARTHPAETILRSGVAATLPSAQGWDWHLRREDGGAEEGRGAALPALPSGIHRLTLTRGGREETVRLVTAPAACPPVEAATGAARVWGVNAALYGLWSARSGELGDFRDLGAAAAAFAGHGADFLGINPVHAIGWSERAAISPYSPSHRGFLNTWHIAADGAATPPDPARPIDYAAHGRAHRRRLEDLHAAWGEDADFDAFRQARGEPLARFALYEALSERHGPDWRDWPAGAEDEAADPARTRFHAWLQWMADRQLGQAQATARGAGMGLGLYLDLAVGSRRGGAESWCERDSIAAGVSLGAPPDHLGPEGQNWQLAAYAPEALARLDYAPLRRIMAEAMRHAGMLRIDHVLGLCRSYWVPDDGSPGGYIRQPFDTLLALVAIEAERAGTVVIGEDLGLVPPGFREALGARGLYGYSVLQYERGKDGALRPPNDLRPGSLACFGTHDTPTLRGFREGRDIEWWQRLGWIDAAAAEKTRAARQDDLAAVGGAAASPAQVRAAVHGAMAASPAAMVSVQLDDLCDHAQAQNLPGTVDEHPNWRRRYAVPVEDFGEALDLPALGETMTRGTRRAT